MLPIAASGAGASGPHSLALQDLVRLPGQGQGSPWAPADHQETAHLELLCAPARDSAPGSLPIRYSYSDEVSILNMSQHPNTEQSHQASYLLGLWVAAIAVEVDPCLGAK